MASHDEWIVEDKEPSLGNVSVVDGDVEGGFLDTTAIHNHTTLEGDGDAQPRKRQRIEASGSGLTSVTCK